MKNIRNRVQVQGLYVDFLLDVPTDPGERTVDRRVEATSTKNPELA